ncbi:MAG: nitronate monooxygenase [Ardenticatenales bacterium]
MGWPKIIQGGMGVAISDWRLASTVAQTGQLGVVSGTGIAPVMIRRLMDGDPQGDTRRALAAFPDRELVEQILQKYYLPDGRPEGMSYKTIVPYSLKPSRWLDAVTAAAGFVEVWLAKEGHDGIVGMNLLEKIQLPHCATLYGAMLAGVDYVLMGAGLPGQIPGILDRLAVHGPARYRVDVQGALPGEDFGITFDPAQVFPGLGEAVGELKRPHFLAIISTEVVAQALLKRAEGEIAGWVVEYPIAGGHNAPPRGPMKVDENGEPIYGVRDEPDLEKLASFGKPYWLAGGYGSHDGLIGALELGAVGVQVGTAFALCDESGMRPDLKQQLRAMAMAGEAPVRTSAFGSPTGFPFKVATVAGTVAEPDVYAARPRLCDMGFLRRIYRRPDGQVGYRCSAEPVEDYIRKGGDEAQTEGRLCLCNHLAATVDIGQRRKDGYEEVAVVTLGNDIACVRNYMGSGEEGYSARDVVAGILGTAADADEPAVAVVMPHAVGAVAHAAVD